jgi:hypothetical protein
MKDIARTFNWLRCLGEILNLKSTTGCQISTLRFWLVEGGGALWIFHDILQTDGTVLDHLGFRWKVLAGYLTDLIACVGFCTSSPQQGVNYQFRFLDSGGRDSMISPWQIQNPTQAPKSVKGPGNIFHLNPKWSINVPFVGNMSWNIYRAPLLKSKCQSW